MIRFADASDFAELILLNSQIESGPAYHWPSELFESELLNIKCLVFIEAGKIVSFVGFRDLPDDFEVSVLGTEPSFRRRGLQSQLIKYLQELAAAQGRRILLEVHQFNVAAANLYRRMGFLQLHERSFYYSDGASALVLQWKL